MGHCVIRHKGLLVGGSGVATVAVAVLFADPSRDFMIEFMDDGWLARRAARRTVLPARLRAHEAVRPHPHPHPCVFDTGEQGRLYIIIDMMNSPDSSRICAVQEWDTMYPEMATGKYRIVEYLLNAMPELKM